MDHSHARAVAAIGGQRLWTHPPPLRSQSLAQVLPPDGGEQETPGSPRAGWPILRAHNARDHLMGENKKRRRSSRDCSLIRRAHNARDHLRGRTRKIRLTHGRLADLSGTSRKRSRTGGEQGPGKGDSSRWDPQARCPLAACCCDEGGGPGCIDRCGGGTFQLDGGADDGPVGDLQERRHSVDGGPRADQDRGVGNSRPQVP